jgi:hypothetical protein
MLKLPKITNKQTVLLYYLYKFYFLNTNQFQKLFHHKKPQTVQKWLKDLKDKKYITIHDFKENKFIANTKPIVYYLTKLAKQKLKENEKCDQNILKRVYQTKTLSNGFVTNCIFLADIYINLTSQMENGEKLHFSTKANLKGFDFFPSPLPDAYIAIKNPQKTRRSFLILINPKIPWRVLDQIIINYVAYTYDNRWIDYSPDPLPSFLIICPNKGTKKHLYKIISNEIPNTSFYLTTKDTIQESGFKGNVWQKVEV